MKKLSSVLLATAVLALAGCAAPSFRSTALDDSYQGRIDTMELVIAQGHFRGAEEVMRRDGLDKRDWYSKVAKDMAQVYAYNGIQATGTGGMLPVGWIEMLGQRNVPTLVVEPSNIAVQRDRVVTMDMQAALFVPGRSRPVWQGKGTVWVHQSPANQLGQQTLNALSNAKLVKLRFADARIPEVSGSAASGKVPAN